MNAGRLTNRQPRRDVESDALRDSALRNSALVEPVELIVVSSSDEMPSSALEHK